MPIKEKSITAFDRMARLLATVVMMTCGVLTQTFGASSPMARLRGTIVDRQTGAPVAGAAVECEGRTVISDPAGKFLIDELAPGPRQVTAAVPGHEAVKMAIDLAPGENAGPPIALDSGALKMEKFVVQGERGSVASNGFDEKAAADALKESVSAADLNRATAQSASDLIKNVAGVAVSRGADGSTNVTVRGLDSRFVRITVDGQRQGGGRNSLDSIPPEIVQSLEVSKTSTPDMDGDAIGGSINVTTGADNIPRPYVQGRQQILFNTLEPRLGTKNAFTLGRPFAWRSEIPNAGVLVTASFDDQYRRRENLRDLREWPALVSPGPAPYTGQLVPVLTQPRLDSTLEHRQRTGVVFNADAKLGQNAFYWRSNFARDWSRRDRRIDDFDPGQGTPLELTPERGVLSGVTLNRRDQQGTTVRDAANFALGDRATIGRSEFDASLGGALADEREPRTLETIFGSDRSFRVSYDTRADAFQPRFGFFNEANPADISALTDPAQYHFNTLTMTRSDARDVEMAARVNVKLNLDDSATTFLKFGGKWQQRRRTVEADRWDYDPGTHRRDMQGLVDASAVAWQTRDYQYGPIPNAEAVAGLLATSPAVLQLNALDTLINSTTGDYQATETISALYGMARSKVGRWTLLGGVRVEATRVRTTGHQLDFAANGALEGVTPVQGSTDYVELLPGLHARYDPSPGLLFRTSITRALSRPNYAELVPARQLNFLDRRSRTGNPALKPYAATNFDVSVDGYRDKIGLLSMALFYKKIDHFVADAQYPITLGALGPFIEFKRINGDSAQVWGAETSWKSPTWSSADKTANVAVACTYTFLGSDTHLPGRPGETFSLSKQARHQGNLTVTAERKRLSIDATVRYRSKSLEDVIDPGLDNYRLPAFDAEVSVAYKLGPDARLTLGASNVLDRPVREYSGVPSRMNEYERDGIDLVFGVQWKR